MLHNTRVRYFHINISDFKLEKSLRFTLVLLSVKLVKKEITERRKGNEFLGKG